MQDPVSLSLDKIRFALTAIIVAAITMGGIITLTLITADVTIADSRLAESLSGTPSLGARPTFSETYTCDVEIKTFDVTPPELSQPRGLALDATENFLFIVDEGNNRVLKYDLAGESVSDTYTKTLSHPYGVAVASDGRIYVSNTGNHKITRFDTSGNAKAWGSLGSGQKQFNEPRGLAVFSDTINGEVLYVADTFNHRIKMHKLNDQLRYLNAWGSYGTSGAFLNYPYGLAVNSSFVYISDTGNNRVVKDKRKNLAYVGAWGSKGKAPGKLRFPRLLTLDSDGKLYVSDAQNNRIQKFSYGTSSPLAVMTPTITLGSFSAPHGVAVKADGTRVYVADTYNHRIVVCTKN